MAASTGYSEDPLGADLKGDTVDVFCYAFAPAESELDCVNQTSSRTAAGIPFARHRSVMIRKIASGKYRLYSRKLDPKTGRRRNLGTFRSRAAAEQHERAVQYFKHQ
jgi:hypothetical protein